MRVLLLDVSGSMEDNAIQVKEHLRTLLQDGIETVLITVGYEVRVFGVVTHVESMLKWLEFNGPCNYMQEAIERAMSEFDPDSMHIVVDGVHELNVNQVPFGNLKQVTIANMRPKVCSECGGAKVVDQVIFPKARESRVVPCPKCTKPPEAKVAPTTQAMMWLPNGRPAHLPLLFALMNHRR